MLTDHFKRYGRWIVGRHVVFRCTNELVTHITANDNHNRASKITDYPQGLVYESLKRRLFFRILRPDPIHGDFLKCQKKKTVHESLYGKHVETCFVYSQQENGHDANQSNRRVAQLIVRNVLQYGYDHIRQVRSCRLDAD